MNVNNNSNSNNNVKREGSGKNKKNATNSNSAPGASDVERNPALRADVRKIRLTSNASDPGAGSSTPGKPSNGPGDIEMTQLNTDPNYCPVATDTTTAPDLPTLRRENSGSERACFICLDGQEDEELCQCCSQCYSAVHRSCWREWRTNQRINVLRSRLMGHANVPNPFLCTICKTGTATVP